MNPSARFSGRAGDESGNDLVRSAKQAKTGADSKGAVTPQYIGRRQLDQLRMSLSERDLTCLRSVAALHFVTARQLERLHFHEAHATPLAAARAARHALARLHDLSLLDRLERRVGGVRAGSASFIYALSRSGARLLGDDNRRRSREPSLAHLAHVLEVAELVVQLHERARSEAGGIELIDVQTEPDCWRSFVDSHGRERLLKPDLRVTIGMGEHELHWFAEIDRATEHRPALARKLRAYVHAWQDGSEQDRVGVFPRTLWVVPDERRAEVIADVCATTDGVPDGMFAVTTADRAVEALTTAPAGEQA